MLHQPTLLSSQAQLHSWFALPSPSQCHRATMNGGCGPSACSSHAFSLLTPSFSLSSPAPAWVSSYGSHSSMTYSSTGPSPSRELKFFTNSSSMCPFHVLQSFRNTPLLHLAGTQVLAENLLQCGLLSTWGHRSCQETVQVWVSHGATTSFAYPPALSWGPSMGCRGNLCSTSNLHRLQGHSSLTLVFIISFRGIPNLVPEACLSLPSPLTLVSSQGNFSHMFSLLSVSCFLSSRYFVSFLK